MSRMTKAAATSKTDLVSSVSSASSPSFASPSPFERNLLDTRCQVNRNAND